MIDTLMVLSRFSIVFVVTAIISLFCAAVIFLSFRYIRKVFKKREEPSRTICRVRYKGYHILTHPSNVIFANSMVVHVKNFSEVTFIRKKKKVTKEMTIAEIEKELGINNLRIVKDRTRIQAGVVYPEFIFNLKET